MPNIDVTELLTDPDFATTITVYRTTQSVNNFGEAVSSVASTSVTAVVVAGVGDTMTRTLDYDMIAGGITIYSIFQLTAGDEAGAVADEVIYDNKRYIVKNLSDWSQFGIGFTVAECVIKRKVS